MPSEAFADLGASRAVVSALEERGIVQAFPVQSRVVPDALEGRDVLVKSPTGSGKTLAFGVPLVERIEAEDPRPTALVLVPTRELAGQIVDDVRPLARARALSVAAVYGGAGIERQIKLARRAHILIATPAASRISLPGGPSISSGCGSSCSTRPTACSTWASGRPSTGSSPASRRTARRSSSRPPSTPRSIASRVCTRATRGSTSTIMRRRGAAMSSTGSCRSRPTRSSGRSCTSCVRTSAG